MLRKLCCDFRTLPSPAGNCNLLTNDNWCLMQSKNNIELKVTPAPWISQNSGRSKTTESNEQAKEKQKKKKKKVIRSWELYCLDSSLDIRACGQAYLSKIYVLHLHELLWHPIYLGACINQRSLPLERRAATVFLYIIWLTADRWPCMFIPNYPYLVVNQCPENPYHQELQSKKPAQKLFI